jgi:adenylate cyclase
MQEIERKFLVHTQLWEALSKPEPTPIVQAYLSDNKNCTVRVRIKGKRGFLTVKGITTGITRTEFEYEIPVADALQMVEELCEKSISKQRYKIAVGPHIWEVDVFGGKLAPLIIAEIELESEDAAFDIPDWIDREVSDDPQYYNSNLIHRV